MISICTYKSPFGELILGSFENQLILCDWKYRAKRDQIDKRIQNKFNSEYKNESCEVIEKAITQLKEYFEGKRTQFDLPILFAGSVFQKSVWNALVAIPFGQSTSYLELSTKLNNVKAIRAVASANGANAISIIVPCHRVIGSKGELTGYAGGLSAKKKLLELEGCNPNGQMTLF